MFTSKKDFNQNDIKYLGTIDELEKNIEVKNEEYFIPLLIFSYIDSETLRKY